MFRKKSPVPEGRQRPLLSDNRQKTTVFSYHANRSAGNSAARRSESVRLQSNGVAANRRRDQYLARWLKRGPVVVGLLLIGAILCSNMLLMSSPRLEVISDGGQRLLLRQPQEYTAAAHELLAESMFNRTKPTINTQKLTQKLKAEFPELAEASLSLPLIGRQPVLHIEPARLALLLAAADGQVYVLDDSGRALIAAHQAPAVAKLGLMLVSDQSGLPVRLGKVALPSTTVNFITEVAGQLKAQKITLESMTLPQGTSELDVRLKGAPYTVKFNVRGDARVEAGAFVAVKQQLERDHKTPAAYIDVRVENRAYYK